MIKLYFCVDGTKCWNDDPMLIVLTAPPSDRYIVAETADYHLNISNEELASINDEAHNKNQPALDEALVENSRLLEVIAEMSKDSEEKEEL